MEDYVQLLRKATNDCTDKKISYTEWGDTILGSGNVYSSDNLRKGFYIVSKILEKIDTNCAINQDDVIEELERLKDEVYMERCKLQDANREKRQHLREYARVDVLKEYIEEKLLELEPRKFEMCNVRYINENEASALISDLHCGATVDSIFNYYDIETLEERLTELATKIIKYCKLHNVHTLHAEFLGDFITGCIHGSTIAQASEDVIDQVLIVSDIISAFIKLLRKEIPCVKTYFVYGNHGRVSTGKSDQANKTNYERLIPAYIRKEFRNTDVKVFDGGFEDFLTYELKDGKLIVVTHGTNDSPISVNKSFTKMLKRDVYEVHMGHYHDYKEGNGSIVNGSVMGSDDYATSRRFSGSPTQVLKVYLGDDETSYKLILK